jgi:hypothetical protein
MMEGVDWIHVAQGRAIMNTLMSLQVPQTAGIS